MISAMALCKAIRAVWIAALVVGSFTFAVPFWTAVLIAAATGVSTWSNDDWLAVDRVLIAAVVAIACWFACSICNRTRMIAAASLVGIKGGFAAAACETTVKAVMEAAVMVASARATACKLDDGATVVWTHDESPRIKTAAKMDKPVRIV